MLFSASRRISWTRRINGTDVVSPRLGQNFCSWVRTSRSWISLQLYKQIISSSSRVELQQPRQKKGISSTSHSLRRRAVLVWLLRMSASSLQLSFYLTLISMWAIWLALPKARSVTIPTTYSSVSAISSSRKGPLPTISITEVIYTKKRQRRHHRLLNFRRRTTRISSTLRFQCRTMNLKI